MTLLPGNWVPIFALETPLLELIVRGSVLYFAILVFMRFMPQRTGGELAMMDLIFIFLIAEAAAHALGDYTAVADGIVLIATLMGWNYLLNFLSFHVPFIESLVSAPPLQVVQDGRFFAVPLHWIPSVANAAPADRAKYFLGEGRLTIHWNPEEANINDDLRLSDYMKV